MKQQIADTLRILSCQMIQNANSGHPGLPLGFADAITALLHEISFDTDDPNWINRDRIAFSCGHGSALWYSILFGFGLLKKNDLDNFRQLHSRTPGHLEKQPGVDITTGPLGMGFSWAIGLALAERILNTKTQAIDHHTYIICSDGDLMEGVAYEAAALAGQYKLHKIIALWDNNSITLDGPLSASCNEDVATRFRAQQWEVIETNGHNIEAVQEAIQLAKRSDKPTLISCKTTIGKHSTLANTHKVHGAPLDKENLAKLKEKLGYNEEPWLKTFFSEFEKLKKNARKNKDTWQQTYGNTDFSAKLTLNRNDILKEQLAQAYATRKHSENILEQLIKDNDNLIIASADLSSSCGTNPKSGKTISAQDYNGNILPCGVRENGMVALVGGINLHGGLHAIASTFLVFYDYARPAIRLAALMDVPLIMIATHDSIALGEDGPTHQPIEHLDSLRCIPNLSIARPADGFETFYCWEKIINKNKPSILILTRQNLPTIHKSFIQETDLIFLQENKDSTIIASGSETHLALTLGKKLGKKVISAPFFEKQQTHTEKVYIIEASTGMTLNYFYPSAKIYNITTFGASGSPAQLLEHFGFTIENLERWLNTA